MNFSPSSKLNDTVGFILHSFLLTPYFAWKSSHRRHHIYANNLEKDHNYVPPKRESYVASVILNVERLDEITEDTPFVVLLRIVLQQVVGFPWYLLTNITASPGSLHQKQSKSFLGNSHFLPSSTLFRPEEASLIILSDLGIAAMASIVWYCYSVFDLPMMALYVVPYMWMNH
jgi:fatty acid desaturase